jgi:predicted negative regulator of RcsB-dependent stress response
VDDYLSEKEQIEHLREWLKENGTSIVVGLALGLAIVGGYYFWKPYREGKLQEASAVYLQMLDAVDHKERDRAIDLAAKLDGYWRTPYADQAALALARLYVEADEPETAAAQLDRVIAKSRDDELVHIAKLRLARVRLYQNQADAALTVLGTVDDSKFAPLYHEVRGDALHALGRSDEARAEYELALQALGPADDRTLLEMKLNDIATPSPSAAADAAS